MGKNVKLHVGVLVDRKILRREHRMKTICGIDCTGCGFKAGCKGCMETNGAPLGGECIAADNFIR